MKQWVWSILFWSVCLFSPLDAAQPVFFTLDNGLQIVLIQEEADSIASVRVLVKTGAIDEGQYLGSGVSHYLEHLVSGGTTSFQTELEYERKLNQMGGATNAYTTSDHTAYFINTTSKHIKKAVSVLSEWMFGASIEAVELRRERSVVIKEMERARASVDRQFYRVAQSNFYKESPLQHPVIGYQDRFNALTRQDIMDYYQQRYCPNNMVLVIGGKFDVSDLKSHIKKTFGKIPQKMISSVVYSKEPLPIVPRKIIKMGNTNQVKMSLRFPTISLNESDLYALDLLEYVLGEGSQSLLVKSLVENQKIATRVSCSSYTPRHNTGYFEIYIELDSEHQDQVKTAILAILDQVKKGGITNAQIRRAKKQKLTTDLFAIKSMESRVYRESLSVLYSGQPGFFKYYVDQFQALDVDDLIRVSEKYLRPEYQIQTVMVPFEDVMEKPKRIVSKKVQDRAPKLKTLANGVQVLLFQDETYPKVEVSIYALGGIRIEDSARNGIGALTARLLGKGSFHYSKTAFQTKMEDNGAAVSGFVGNNVLSYQLMCLSDDIKDLAPVFFDSFLHLDVKASDFAEEKRLLLTAIEKRSESWQSYAMYQFRQHFYDGHAYGLSRLGEKKSVRSLSLEQVFAFYQQLLDPSRLVITVMGKYDESVVIPLIEGAFLSMKKPDNRIDFSDISSTPQHFQPKEKSLKIPQDVGAVFVGFDAVSVENEKARVRLDLLDSVLSGMSYPGGRLHSRLRGEGLVYVVHAYQVPLFDKGYFMIYALTDKQNVQMVKRIIMEEVSSVQRSLLSKDELNQAKAQLVFDYQDRISTLSGLSLISATDLFYTGQKNTFQRRLSFVSTIQPKDLKKTANVYLVNPQIYIFK